MDAEARYRAVEGRDARFAGTFFLGVRSTGIFCRPGCPARTPRRENIVFFESPQAAREAGFRACLRCRPESAFAPDTARTLSRALRLLEESGDPVGLAERLGITERHLRRIFAQHLGASPGSVLRARRLEVARQLIEGSALPMIDIAHAAGFQSLRRFNAAVRDGLGSAPSALRRKTTPVSASLSLRLPFHPPLDFAALLDFFMRRALPGIESVEDGVWKRVLPEGAVEVRQAGASHLEVRIPAALAPRALQLAARVRRLFDLRTDPAPIVAHLGRDAALRPFLRPGLRIPGAWDPFEMAVRAVAGQQISVARATEMAAALGPLTPEALARGDIRGTTAARAEAIAALARAVLQGSVRLDGSQSLEQCAAALCAIRGVGDWTAQLIALRALGEPDAFPAADLVLCRALRLDANELRERSEAWRPWRGYAAAAIWLST